MTSSGDTIAAIATAPGRGGVAIVRISGGDAFAVAEALTGRKMTPGRIALAKVLRDGAVIDECVVLAFASPRSYTGEDVVELQCHGGTLTPRRILEACFAAGARLANRGEFTARAFLNGRLGLDAAEGVLDLIDARTDRAADAALARMGGAESKRNRELYDRALALSVALEHALDVDEGELSPEWTAARRTEAEGLRGEIAAALKTLHAGHLLRNGALVVLAGPPNAGKSSLMNALLGSERAIVSAEPGTTRDSIEEWLDVGGWPVRLTDTAGLRGTGDAIEAEGVRRANGLIADADVVVALDCDIPGALRIHAKCDLGRSNGSGCLQVSARTGEGLAELCEAIADRLSALAAKCDDVPGPDARTASLLTEALAAIEPSDDPVLAANAARSCAEALGRLAGAVYSDDLLDSLFSRFCVGK